MISCSISQNFAFLPMFNISKKAFIKINKQNIEIIIDSEDETYFRTQTELKSIERRNGDVGSTSWFLNFELNNQEFEFEVMANKLKSKFKVIEEERDEFLSIVNQFFLQTIPNIQHKKKLKM